MMQETDVDGVTVARGCIGNPWIFQQARALFAGQPIPPPPSLFEQREVILEHFRLAEELYGEDRAGVPMRKFGIKYSQLHPESLAVRAEFAKVKNLQEWKNVLEKWYSEDLPGIYPQYSELESECE